MMPTALISPCSHRNGKPHEATEGGWEGLKVLGQHWRDCEAWIIPAWDTGSRQEMLGTEILNGTGTGRR